VLLIGASRSNTLDKQAMRFVLINSRILVPEASSCESVDGEGCVKCVERAPPHNISNTLFMKERALAHGGLQSVPIVDVYGISIRNRPGCTFRSFPFFTSNETEWHRIS
jgi:hypothetical protein